MSPRRTPRQLVVAVLVGVLVGGGLLAVTPAGAEVTQVATTNWKKIWKQELKPLADRRYYTKEKSNAKYQPKGAYDAAGAAAAAQAAATAASNLATDTKLGNYNTKALADARYVLSSRTTTGVFVAADTAAAAGQTAWASIQYGSTLPVAPTAVVVAVGATDARCPGTVESPSANPGFLCIFQATLTNAGNLNVWNVTGNPGTSRHGALVWVSAAKAGYFTSRGSWAVTPAA